MDKDFDVVSANNAAKKPDLVQAAVEVSQRIVSNLTGTTVIPVHKPTPEGHNGGQD
jgi:hypothetical protein